jgi:hypothetical protein
MHAAILVLSLLSAQADETSSDEAKANAQALLSEGTQLFDRGAMAEALVKFKQAYAEFASPKLLFNIGLTSRSLGRMVEAMNALEQFLAEATDTPPDMIAEAKKSVAELRGLLASLSVKCDAPGAEIALDGRTIGFAPLPNSLWVMPGNHLVTAKHASFQPASVAVDVNASTVHTLTLPMQPLRAEEPAAATNVSRDNPPADITSRTPEAANQSSADISAARPRGWWLGRKWTWVAASSAVVLAGGAVAFGLSMQSTFDGLNQRCGSASPGYSGCTSDDISSVTWRRDTANVLWALSGAAAATAVALFVLEGHNVSVAPIAGDAMGFVGRVTY